MKLIVMIPAYNEEKSIEAVIKEIPKSINRIEEIKIFVIDDGSTDQTKKVALAAGADKVISNKKNLGLARTFQKGLLTALKDGADIIVNTDADGQYNPKEINQLVEPIINKKADIVIGDRQVKKLEFMKWGNKYGNVLGSWVLRKLTKSDVNDASSGFRAFSREAALRINVLFNHTYTHETIIQAVFNNLTIANIPIEFRARLTGPSRLIHNIFKHIKTSGLIIIRTILLYKPLKTLIYLGLIMIIPGIIIGLRFIYYFIVEGGAGKIQSLILAAIFILIGFFIIILGFLGDLIANNRKLNEEILYNIRKNNFKK